MAEALFAFFRSRVYYWHAEGLVYLLSTRTVGRPFLLLLLPSSLSGGMKEEIQSALDQRRNKGPPDQTLRTDRLLPAILIAVLGIKVNRHPPLTAIKIKHQQDFYLIFVSPLFKSRRKKK